ncbi:hypothetical protein PpBr36_03917 [Pyricularia pennisetigena]|uniref:hypothetical protein n=1 Tax=Pyricularia pennisetigena TaxID=1578925 RepID=UPI001152CE38|nr:hypothetical protein PpBr36_03917 [Pyricularia pennisetigena]TLS30738.1 hypothetical protein PpBr36_03917 [Pyricularia pennisetigena]
MKFTSILISFFAAAVMAAPATSDNSAVLEARQPPDGLSCASATGTCRGGKCIVKGKEVKDDRCTSNNGHR